MEIPPWYTPAVRGLALELSQNFDKALLPVLADALEEAGYTHADNLRHLRYEHDPSLRFCCIIDDLVRGDFDHNPYL